MGIMGLGLDPGKTVTIEVTGEDEEEAITAISDFLEKWEYFLFLTPTLGKDWSEMIF